MEEINPVVAAKVATELARARQEVAKLESRQRTAAINTGGSWRGVNLGKLLTEARWQAESWQRVYDAMAGLGGVALEAARNASAPAMAPAQGWMSNGGLYLCTRPKCLASMDDQDTDWFPQTAAQLDGAEACMACGEGVLR